MTFSIRTGERLEFTGAPLEPYRRVPVVELWVGGIKFTTDCDSDEHARQLVVKICDDIGVNR